MRRGEMDRVGAVKRERVGRDLHHARLVTGVEHLPEGSLEVDRLRRRAQDLVLDAADHALDGAQQARLASAGLQERAHEKRRRGLAVGPGDAHGGEVCRGVSVEARGGGRHRGAHRRDLDLGHASAGGALDHERDRTPGDGVGREIVPVARVAGHAEEQGPVGDEPVVVGERGDLDVSGGRRELIEQERQAHRRTIAATPAGKAPPAPHLPEARGQLSRQAGRRAGGRERTAATMTNTAIASR